MNWKLFASGSMAAAVAASMAPAAIAQQITSEVRGIVTNQAGDPVRGATVTVVDTRTSATRTLTTGGNGLFQAGNLTVGGPYTITATASGFQGQTVSDVFLRINADSRFTFELDDTAAVLDTVVVTASQAGLQQLAIGPSGQFGLEELENFPSISRDIRDIIRFDPRVVVEDDNISCLGGAERSNSFTIDGVRSGDGFGLNSSGFPNRNSLPLPFDAIRETSVEFAPFDVEYGQFTGCNINVVTKSGTNDFEASAFAVFSGDALSGVDTAEGFMDFNWGATVGGPIIKDRLFFFAAYEEVRDGGEIVNFGPAGSGLPIEASFFTLDQFNTVSDILGTTFGRDTLGLGDATSETNRRILGRFDWIINDNHRLEFTYNRLREEAINDDDLSTDTVIDGVGTSGLLSFGDNFEIEGSELDNYSARLFSQWTDNFSTELRASRADVQDIQNPLGGGEAAPGDPGVPRIVVFNSNGPEDGGFLVSGPGVFRSANDLSTQIDQIEFRGDWNVGAHTLSFGYELDQLDVFNLFVANATNTLNFGSIDDLAAGILTDGTTVDDFTPEDAGQLAGLIGGFGAGSATGDIADSAASFSRAIHAVYVQDEWTPHPDLTLALGLRYEFYNTSDAPEFNQVFFDRYGFSNANFVDGIDIFLPRFGLTYDASDFIPNTSIRAGAGVFTGGDPTVFFSNAFSNTGASQAEGFTSEPPCTDADLDVVDAAGNFTGVPQCIIDQQIANASTFLGDVAATDPDLDIPSVIRGNFGVTHFTDFNGAIGGFFDDWSVNIDLIHTRSRNTFQFADLTLAEIGTAPDGRPLFNAVDPLLPGCDAVFNGIGEFGFTAPAGQLDQGGVCDAGTDDQDILLTNFDGDNGGSTVISAQFAKTWEYTTPLINKPGQFDFNLGYAYTTARDRQTSLSSTATSNFEEVATADFNDPPLSPNRFVNNHNVTLTAQFEQEFFSDLASQFSLFFNASSGDRFAFAFDGATSVFTFGDSDFESRSLFFVPSDPITSLGAFTQTGDPEDDPDDGDFGIAPGFFATNTDVFVAGTIDTINGGVTSANFDIDEFNAFIASSGLDEFAGGIAPRGAFRDPFFLDLDVRFQQELPSFTEDGSTFVFVDIENLPNLIDGGTNLRQQFFRGDVGEAVPIGSATIEEGQFVIDFAGGPGLDVVESDSLWEVQFGIRFTF